MRLVLLPGLAADERMFARIREGFGGVLVTPRLLVPKAEEDMAAYARRTASSLNLSPTDVIGGASFGSMLASAIARQMPVAGLVLIGGALSSAGLRQKLRGMRFLELLPRGVVRSLMRSRRGLQMVFGREADEFMGLAQEMLEDVGDDLLLLGAKMITSYYPEESAACPAFAIHGGKDKVMSPPPVPGCIILPDGGHGIAWTHAKEVSTFLEKLARI